MVKLTIDGTELQVKDGTTILDAALQAGIHIPTLCYLKKLNKIGACRVCMVEVEGNSKLEVEINQMQYGLCRIAVSESEESYYYVPAVLFRGTIQIYRGDTGELINEETTTLVTINAIDGTII